MSSRATRIARLIARQRALVVTEVAGIAVCEQRAILAQRLGERKTPLQRLRAREGVRGHAVHDRFVRSLSAWDNIRTALAFGIFVGLPMIVVAQVIDSLVPRETTIAHAVADGLLAPLSLYEAMTQRSIYSDLPSLVFALALQVSAYALGLLLARALLSSWRARPRTA